MNDTTPKNPFNTFQHGFNTFSTGFQQLFAFFDKSLVFFVFASKIRQLLITSEACCHFAPPTRGVLSLRADPIFQTESKGNFESMSLYRHIARFQPQAIRAKKQTFPNNLSYVSPLRREGFDPMIEQPH